ncbi:hypothetical protein [Spirillospora sp. NPDC048819]|uniref:WD40/YVTN/BNR-like repeat-containing protein n=1 Tax=Spirillospora sp. NPDC048819 TaxID=3155268 RepID=UPI0033FE1CE3
MKRALAVLALLASVMTMAAPATTAHAADGEWRRVGLPFLWPSAGLGNISATGPSDVWVAGVQGAFCIPQIASWGCSLESDGNPVVRRWNGSAWEEFPLHGWSGNGPMETVAAAAPDDVWVSYSLSFIADPPRYLARFDGTGFIEVDPPEAGTGFEVAANAAGTWVMTHEGEAPLYRRAGDGWQPVAGTGLSRVMDMAARTSTDAWAVGQGGPDGRSAIAHWDGQIWQPVDFPYDGPALYDVLPVSATDVWAAETGTGRLVRWNGSTWSQVTLPDGVEGVHLAVDGSGTVWAGGAERVVVDGYHRRRPVLLSYAGGTWQRTPVSMPWGANTMSISDLTTVPGHGSIWLTANTSTGPVVLAKESTTRP